MVYDIGNGHTGELPWGVHAPVPWNRNRMYVDDVPPAAMPRAEDLRRELKGLGRAVTYCVCGV